MRGTAKQAAHDVARVVQEALNVLGIAKVTLSAGPSRAMHHRSQPESQPAFLDRKLTNGCG